jgi:hypothetical protein
MRKEHMNYLASQPDDEDGGHLLSKLWRRSDRNRLASRSNDKDSISPFFEALALAVAMGLLLWVVIIKVLVPSFEPSHEVAVQPTRQAAPGP